MNVLLTKAEVNGYRVVFVGKFTGKYVYTIKNPQGMEAQVSIYNETEIPSLVAHPDIYWKRYIEPQYM